MDWKEVEEELTVFLWGKPVEADATKDAKQLMPFIQQLLDQRDEEIIGKLEKLSEKQFGIQCSDYHEALEDAISTIKENK